MQVVVYKAGSVFTGGTLLWFHERFGWSPMFTAFASLYFATVLLFRRYRLADRQGGFVVVIGDRLTTTILFYNPLQNRSSAELRSDRAKQREDEEEQSPFSWSDILRVKGTLYIAFFVCLYKLCERAEQTFSLFLVDKGVPAWRMALWATVVRSASLAGSARGGAILSGGGANVWSRAKRVLLTFSLLRTLPIAGQQAIILFWGKER